MAPKRSRSATPVAPQVVPSATPMRVAFLHPDLGLGGAERLVVDAASGLAHLGHSVVMYTSHYEPQRSFDETRSGLFGVLVYGDWLPRALFGRFHIVFAMLRMVWLALCVVLWHGREHDVLIVDQVSACIPLLKLLCPGVKLLASRKSLLRRVYRAPFDFFEELTTGLSDSIVVNSHFTLSVFRGTFRLLTGGGINPSVLYPCVSIAQEALPPPPTTPILLSINRYERKKEVVTALKAFAAASMNAPPPHHSSGKAGKGGRNPWHLVIAGGYDPRVAENVVYFEELCTLAQELGLVGKGGLMDASASSGGRARLEALLPGWGKKEGGGGAAVTAQSKPSHPVLMGESITLIRSFSDGQKGVLLGAAHAIAYTPPNEHFGIVPLECMAAGRPVVCDASGGPLESVVGGETGWLCSGGVPGWTAVLKGIAGMSREALQDMGRAGREHVIKTFSRQAFASELERQCRVLVGRRGGEGGCHTSWIKTLLWAIFATIALAPALGLSHYSARLYRL